MRMVATLLLLTALAGCAGMGEPLPPPVSVAEVIQMARDGQSAEVIIKRMYDSRMVYNLPASELARLREQGVPDQVIDYMQQTYVEAVRYAEWIRARDAFMFPMYPGPPYRAWRYPYGWW